NKRMGAENFSNDSPYLDKGIDFKFRLLEESDYLPEVAVGVRDFGGTGLFDGEFIAGSKKIYTDHYGVFDFTLGMGWGYMGMHGNVTNPFCKANAKFCDRPSDYGGQGGEVDYQRWFRGPAAIYGGIEYQTPYQPLRFKIEYDTNDYSEDFPTKFRPNNFYEVDMTQHTPWNVGMIYRVHEYVDLRLSYERGDTISAGVSLRTNYNEVTSS
ncbi:MAG: YjbH domain-containing protein, partial [Alteromonas sp.]|nr:YjbH domain-containing protein [Alteromonas sp.]